MEQKNTFDIKSWWNEHFKIMFEASYATHADMNSQTGILMTIIKGVIL